MFNAQDIHYFLEVASTLNITRASERLGISQPAVSQALGRLESDLGVKLLMRGKTGVQLTRAGHRVVRQSQAILHEWNNLKKSAHEEEESLGGQFKVGCHPSVAIYTLGDFLPAFLLKYPEIEIHLKHGLSREIANDIINWKLDLGLVVNPPKHPDLVIKELFRDRVTFWKNPNTKLNDVLIYNPELMQVQNLLGQIKKQKMKFKRHVESTNLEVILQMASTGAGIAILPTRVAKLSKVPLKKAFQDSPEFEDKICLVYRVGTATSASAKVLLSELQLVGKNSVEN